MAWLVSHAVGIGFVVDAVFLGVGVVAVGLAVFSGIDELVQFGNGAIAARNLAQLDDAAKPSLSMYLEEALAESFAQVSVQGLRGLLTGITFPVRYGHVSLFTKYTLQDGIVMPVVPEIAGMFLGSINVKGWMRDMHFSPAQPR